MYRVSVMYPYDVDRTFDLDYYCKVHMPMVERLVGKEILKRWSVEKGVGVGGKPPVYSAVGVLFVESLEGFTQAFDKHALELARDVPNFAQIAPIAVFTEIVV